MRALCYARVSTSHHDQKPEVQIETLRIFCFARGWEVCQEVVDEGFSGANDRRPGLSQLLKYARARKVDVIVVTKLDRLARSVRHLVTILDELVSLNVDFVSVGDQIDMTSPSGRLMFHIVGAFAEFEKSLVSERTRSGLEHARRKGKILGRPKIRDDLAILKLRSQGLSYSQIDRHLKCGRSAIYRALKTVAKTSPITPVQGFEITGPRKASK